MPIYTDILKELRKDKKISQWQMGRRLGRSQSAYSYYESGLRKMPLSMLNLLAEELGTSTDYILGRTPQIKPYPPRRKPLK